MAERRLILRRAKGVLLANKMDLEIALVIIRERLHQNTPAHVWIMKAKWNARGTIIAITQQTATAAMALIDRDVIINAVSTLNKEVIEVEENGSREKLKIQSVPLLTYMGDGTEGLHEKQDEIHAEHEAVAVQVQVWWLASPLASHREARMGRSPHREWFS